MNKATWLRACFLVVGAIALVTTPRVLAQQYVTSDDFDVVWTLDPRGFPGVFNHAAEHGAFGARSVLTGMDLDGDGMKEILFTTDETLAPAGPDPGFLDVFLYEATGDNTYQYVWHYTHVDASNSLPPVAYGDIDGDGLWEIYFGIPTINDDPEDLFVFEQDETGVFPESPTTTWGYERDGALDFRPSGFAIADVDGDEVMELVTTSRKSGAREVVVASVVGDLSEFTTWNIEFEAGEDLLGGGGIYDVDVADFDGDGLNEIWVNTWDLWSMTIFEATGTDTYELQVDINRIDELNDPGSFNSHDLHFVDIDGDESLELYLPMTNGRLYFIDDVDDVSTLTAENVVTVGAFDPLGNSDARGADGGDIDGDGLLDIVASHGRGEKISRIEYQGEGSPADSTSYTWEIILDSSQDLNVERFYPPRIGNDLDGDGQNEVVLTNLYGSAAGQHIIIVLELSGSATANERSTLPGGYHLDQNYPNPFNPTTTISFTLAESEQVSLKVYDMMGREVRSLADGRTMAGGTHTMEWDGRDALGAALPSGAYVYTLAFGDYRQSRTMVLLK